MSADTHHGNHKASEFGYGPVSADHRKKQDEIAEEREARLYGPLEIWDPNGSGNEE